MPKYEPFEVGDIFEFYGVDGLFFKVNDLVIQVVEDEDDGYRSYLGSVEVREGDVIKDLIFFKTPLATVLVRESTEHECDGYELVDSAGHVWLSFGTDNRDDYYPSFCADWVPSNLHVNIRAKE